MSDPHPSAAIIGIGANTERKGGYNAIAYAHAWAMRDLGVPLVAAAARSAGNREGFAREFPAVPTYADYQQMLRTHRPQLVSICAYPRDREAMAMAALENGARILWIEKPLAISLDAAERILAAAEAAKARVFVHHQRRFGHPFRILADACAQGRLGTIQSVTIAQPFPDLMGFGVHLVDTAMSCLPGRKVLHAFGSVALSDRTCQDLPVEAECHGVVRLDDGSRLVIGCGPESALVPAIRVDGSHGFAELVIAPRPGEGGILRARWRDSPAIEAPLLLENFHHDYVDRNLSVLRFLDDLLGAAREQRSSPCDGRESLRSLAAVLALFESAERGAPVSLPFAQASFPLDRIAERRRPR